MPTNSAWTMGRGVKWSLQILAALVGLGGFVVAVISLVLTIDSLRIASDAQALSQKAYDRAAGKLEATISVRGEDGASDVSDNASLDSAKFGVFVKNTGKESIDMVRINVVTSSVWSHPKGAALNFGIGDGGGTKAIRQRNESESFDESLPTMLQGGKEIRLDLKRQIVSRLQKIEFPADAKAEELFVIFQATFNGRLVGHQTPSGICGDYVTGRDGVTFFVGGSQSISVTWRPATLSKDALARFLDSYHPAPP
jgi:hypothetical protein